MIRQLDKIYRLDHAVSKKTQKSCAECIWKNFLETKGLLVEAEDYVEKAIQDTEELPFD